MGNEKEDLTILLNKNVEKYKEQMIDLTCRLIQAPSEVGHEGETARILLDELNSLPFDEILTDKVGNITAIIKGSGGKNILFNAHLDQVAPGDLDLWEFAPFEGIIQDGFIHGRGASDTKGAIATMVYGALAAKDAATLKGDIILTFVVAEEPGDMWGMIRLFEDGFPYSFDLAVIEEATDLDIALGHKGRLEVELECIGKSSHSSTPWNGVNAIDKLMPVLLKVNELAGNLPSDPVMGQASLCLLRLVTEPAWGSCVPDIARANFDRRYLPTENVEDILSEIDDIVQDQMKQDSECNITARIRQLKHVSYTGEAGITPMNKPAYLTSADDPMVAAAKTALENVGQKPKFMTWDFGTDGAYVSDTLGVPTIGYSCSEIPYLHTPFDRVSIEKMIASAVGNAAMCVAICG